MPSRFLLKEIPLSVPMACNPLCAAAQADPRAIPLAETPRESGRAECPLSANSGHSKDRKKTGTKPGSLAPNCGPIQCLVRRFIQPRNSICRAVPRQKWRTAINSCLTVIRWTLQRRPSMNQGIYFAAKMIKSFARSYYAHGKQTRFWP